MHRETWSLVTGKQSHGRQEQVETLALWFEATQPDHVARPAALLYRHPIHREAVWRHDYGDVNAQTSQIILLLSEEAMHGEGTREVPPFEENIPHLLEGDFSPPEHAWMVHAVSRHEVGNTSFSGMLRKDKILENPSAVEHDQVCPAGDRVKPRGKPEPSVEDVPQREAFHPLWRG